MYQILRGEVDTLSGKFHANEEICKNIINSCVRIPAKRLWEWFSSTKYIRYNLALHIL